MNIPRHVMESFFEPLLAVFGEPTAADPERFLTEYGRHLKGYASLELQKASDHLAITHKGPARWPKLAECIDACDDARASIQARQQPKREGLSYREAADLAEQRMMQSELGHEACRDGWANGLREFLMERKRWPQDHEIHRMKANADFIDRCAAGLIDMGLMHVGLLDLAAKLQQRRHAIADRVQSGTVREKLS